MSEQETNIVDVTTTPAAIGGEDLSWVLIKPRISEKAVDAGTNNVYVFEVDPRANKILVKKAVKAQFGVDAAKVNIMAMPKKSTFVRGHRGSKGGGKKAMVFLKKGDSITF